MAHMILKLVTSKKITTDNQKLSVVIPLVGVLKKYWFYKNVINKAYIFIQLIAKKLEISAYFSKNEWFFEWNYLLKQLLSVK